MPSLTAALESQVVLALVGCFSGFEQISARATVQSCNALGADPCTSALIDNRTLCIGLNPSLVSDDKYTSLARCAYRYSRNII